MRWMTPVLAGLLVQVAGCRSCDKPGAERPEAGAATASDPFLPVGEARAVVRLARVELTGQDRLGFYLYLDRLDLTLTQPDNSTHQKLTADLPESLRPKLIYVSEPADESRDGGSLCDRPRFPHLCEITLTQAELKAGRTVKRIKILFGDQRYGTALIEVPSPVPLGEPVIVEPSEAPSQQSPLEVRFKDVGADRYVLETFFCRAYENDGINPCMDAKRHELRRDGKGGLTSTPEATVDIADGTVSLRSELITVAFDDKVDYQLEAVATRTLPGGLSARVTHRTQVSFKR